MRKTILTVDDEPSNLALVERSLSGNGYKLKFATSGMEALDVVSHNHDIDLILLDVMMPGMDGLEVCRRLKIEPSTSHIPIIFVTAKGEIKDEAEGFKCGAVDYITKPISPAILAARVHTHLSLVQASKLEELSQASIFMLGDAGHYNDNETGVHVWRMADYAAELAKAAGYDSDKVEMMRLAAPLHDTGKIGIPDAVLKKPDKLNPDEWEIMKTHAQIGSDILSKSKLPLFQAAAVVCLNHHERWDGSGYPRCLIGEDIPEQARIVAVADVFDALTMWRPYKDAWDVQDAFAELENIAGTHLEPRLVELFLDIEPQILKIKKRWDIREKETGLR